jgi:hypothetical protein
MANTFPTRKAWFDHEKTHHLSQRRLQCRICTEKFDDTDTFILHARNDHDVSINSPSIRSAVLSTATTVDLNPLDCLDCPLCHQKEFSSYRSYATHVGHHLEEVALCALPPNNDQDDTIDIDGTDSSGDSDSFTDLHFPLFPRFVNLTIETETGPAHLLALQDTGAEFNIISETKAKALGLPLGADTTVREATGLGGHTFYSLGTVSVRMRLEFQVEERIAQFEVFPDSTLVGYQVIVGARWIAEFGRHRRHHHHQPMVVHVRP